MKNKFKFSKEAKLLSQFSFHDSEIEKIELNYPSPGARTCKITIEHFDHGKNASSKVVIYFGFVAKFEHIAPDLCNPANEISSLAVNENLVDIFDSEEKIREDFPRYKSPLFNTKEEATSLFFLLTNGSISNEENFLGHLLIVGNAIKVDWEELS